MPDVSISQLRKHASEIVDRAPRGELLTITRAGKRVAELRPAGRPALSAETLLARWRRLPALDSRAARPGIAGVVDAAV